MRKVITYARHIDGYVISRVGGELAWPILNYAEIGRDGNYNAPLTYTLEKVNVHSVGREWDSLVWSRKIPTSVKNEHRRFWGMKPLKRKARHAN